MNELRVFPRRTSYTPTDPMVAVGDPGLFRAEGVDRISVSCVFTWDKAETERLAAAWKAVYPEAQVDWGGPAYDHSGGDFTPGRFVKPGISISSRGCPEKCPWCLVRRREGALRLLPISEGWAVNDNNATAFPRAHWERLCWMLNRQKKAVRFVGGLQASRMKDWHFDWLKWLRIGEIFLAADHDGAVGAVKKAAERLKLPRKKMRCYVMLGYNGETIERAERRLEAVWEAGCLPFPQLYRDPADQVKWSAEWRRLARKWSRPAAVKAMHR